MEPSFPFRYLQDGSRSYALQPQGPQHEPMNHSDPRAHSTSTAPTPPHLPPFERSPYQSPLIPAHAQHACTPQASHQAPHATFRVSSHDYIAELTQTHATLRADYIGLLEHHKRLSMEYANKLNPALHPTANVMELSPVIDWLPGLMENCASEMERLLDDVNEVGEMAAAKYQELMRVDQVLDELKRHRDEAILRQSGNSKGSAGRAQRDLELWF